MLPDEDDPINAVEYHGVTYDADQEIGTTTAALIAHRNRRTIINWCRKGYLKSMRIGGPRGQYVIIIGDLVSVLQVPGNVDAVA